MKLNKNHIKVEYIRVGKNLYPTLHMQSDDPALERQKTFHIGTEKICEALKPLGDPDNIQAEFACIIPEKLIFTGSHDDIVKAVSGLLH